jgi:Flp pilus assembly protein TadG
VTCRKTVPSSIRPSRATDERCLSHPQGKWSEFVGSLARCHRPQLLHECGQSTLETAVSLMVAFSLFFWMFELCMFSYTCSILNDAAQEGVRYAIMHGKDSSVCSGPDSACTNQSPYSNVQAAVTSVTSASLHNMTAMTVTVNYANGTAAAGNPVTVKVAYTYVPYLNLPGLQNAVAFTSQGRIVY